MVVSVMKKLRRIYLYVSLYVSFPIVLMKKLFATMVYFLKGSCPILFCFGCLFLKIIIQTVWKSDAVILFFQMVIENILAFLKKNNVISDVRQKDAEQRRKGLLVWNIKRLDKTSSTRQFIRPYPRSALFAPRWVVPRSLCWNKQIRNTGIPWTKWQGLIYD